MCVCLMETSLASEGPGELLEIKAVFSLFSAKCFIVSSFALSFVTISFNFLALM